ncbi:MAG: CRISPR-associated protein Csx14 [Anaerolineae bacterium]|nr:CRISPR-associated protein Csx14 [Anaerolineae bacterium]
MPKSLLVATLGTSPAVVTEAIDLLAEQGVQLDGVILFTTEDYDVQESLALLSEHLPTHEGLNWVQSVRIAAHEDIRTSEAAVEFMEEACRILKTYRDNGDRLFVCIAGGRKAMSSLLALAVQFYGAERLFHIWAPPWMEAEGEIGKLRGLPPEQLHERLHPPLNASDDDRPHMVDLPFLGLFPLLGDILGALKGHSIPTRDVKQMLVAAGLLTTRGDATSLGQRVAEILDNVEGLPPARQDECKVHIGKHHYQDRLKQFAEEVCARFPFVTKVQSMEWKQGEEQVKPLRPNVLIVGTRLDTDILFRFELVTTATNPGQLEAARKAVERWIRRRG